MVPVTVMAAGLVALFAVLNLRGMRRVTVAATWIAAGSAALAFASALIPIATGHVDWQQASTFHLISPFSGVFGGITSAMAGLYLIGFAAPAFEAAACHVGEMRDHERNLPRAMYASAGMATLYFLVLPVVWLGVLGPASLTGDLAATLGPTFAPLLFGAAKAAAIWFMVLNMFHGTLTPLSGASRTLSQLSEDGLLPRTLASRNRARCTVGRNPVDRRDGDAVLAGRRPGVGDRGSQLHLPHRDRPAQRRRMAAAKERTRPASARTVRRAGPSGSAFIAALVWLLTTVLGFEQFGLPTVLVGLGVGVLGLCRLRVAALAATTAVSRDGFADRCTSS